MSPKEQKLSEILAHASSYTYKQINNNILSLLEKETGIYNAQPFCCNINIPYLMISGLLGYYEDYLVLALKGSNSIWDWLTDINLLHNNEPLSWKKQSNYSYGGVNGKVHSGFNKAVNQNFVELKSLLKNRCTNQNQKILLTGHSLGGAMAILLAIGLSGSHEFPSQKIVYTYGAPRVGDTNFRISFDRLKEITHYRFEYMNDIVPQLPLALPYHYLIRVLKTALLFQGMYIPSLGLVPQYEHTGILRYLAVDEQENLIVTETVSELKRFFRRLQGYGNNTAALGSYLVKGHHIENYIEHIKNLNQKRSKHTSTGGNMITLTHVLALIQAAELAGKINIWLKNTQIMALLTYRDTINYFVQERPKYPLNTRGVVLRQESYGKIKIYQVFLDSKEELVCYPDGKLYGRLLQVKQLDEELEERFGNTNMIVVE